jgi:hypothetical protein
VAAFGLHAACGERLTTYALTELVSVQRLGRLRRDRSLLVLTPH